MVLKQLPFRWRRLGACIVLCLLAAATPGSPGQHDASQDSGLGKILSYIESGWDSLTRSTSDCNSIVDPKLSSASVLYLPANFEAPPAIQRLRKECHVQVKRLPMVIHALGEADPKKIIPPGLLFLKNKYVVPGGRFNEMYGWDSYFILRGLLRGRRIDLAQGMVENFFFEIEHYGAVLNANRTYYLTRSQPPLLTSMILEVYQARKSEGHEDPAWLAKAYDFAKKDYALWTRRPHLAGSTGLSRYYDFGSGPAPEATKDERGHYRDATADYYKGDRSMRESGFDVSFRFGPHGARTHHFAPVCLNSLLYKTEKDLEQMSTILGRKTDANDWHKRADQRKDRIQEFLWDDGHGLYFDHDLDKRKRSSYEYATTFYPLWAGISTPEQAQAVMRHLSTFEKPGGLVMSPYETGGQWDYPYAWAPIQLLATEGMRRYGFKEDADRISYQFLSMVSENFFRDGTIREKYNGVTRSSEIQVKAGYPMNVVGFGWTNGVFLELLHQLPPLLAERLAGRP